MPLSALDLATVTTATDARTALKHTRELAQHVERLGFTRFWLAEHHNMPGVASSSPAILIGHVADATTTLRVGSGGVMLPNHAPLVVAEQFALLEAAFPGRIDLGIGRAPGTDPVTTFALQRDRRVGASAARVDGGQCGEQLCIAGFVVAPALRIQGAGAFQLLLRTIQVVARQQHLAREAVPEHPQDLVADVRLQAIERQDHPALVGEHGPQPPVVGEIFAGVLLGPSLLGAEFSEQLFPLDTRPFLSLLASIGLVLFMFVVGLELDVSVIKGRGRVAGSVSILSIALPFATGFGLALVLRDLRQEGADLVPFALFIGAAMSITAFPVLARILTDRRMHRTETGGLALASAAVDDVLAWTMLAVVIGGLELAVRRALGQP